MGDWVTAFEHRNGRQPSGYAVKGVIVALRSFYGPLSKFGLLVDETGRYVLNPTLAITIPVIQQKANDWLRQEEDERLLSTLMSPEEEAVVWVLRWTGVRNSELRSIRVRDVDMTDGVIYVTKTKNDKPRAVPIVDELRPHLNKWLHISRTRVCTGRTGRSSRLETERPGLLNTSKSSCAALVSARV